MRYALAPALLDSPRWPLTRPSLRSAGFASAAAALMFLALALPMRVDDARPMDWPRWPLASLVSAAAAEETKTNPTDIEVGSGLVCDTLEQVQRYIEVFRGNPVEAAKQVNKEAGQEEACAFGTVAFVRGADVARVRDNEDKPVKIAEILVVGIGTTGGMMEIQPQRWFTLFPTEEILI